MITRIFTAIFIVSLLACADNADKDADLNTEAPAALDSTTKHPNGMTNGSVISTDTAAMRVVDSTDN